MAGPEQIRLGADVRAGQFAVHNPGKAAEAITISAAEWITPDPASFTLAPGETRQVAFTVAVPDNATPGDRPIRIDVAATLDDAAWAAAVGTLGGNPIRSRLVSVVTVVVRVPGAILASVTADAGIPGFRATTSGSVTFTPTIANTGNVAAAWQAVSAADAPVAVPTLHLASTLGWLADDTMLFGGMDDGAGGFRPAPVTVLPGATLQEQIVLRDAPLLGSYDYTYTLPATGADGLTAVTQVGHVVVLNLRKLAVVLLLPLAGLLALLLAWRLVRVRGARARRRSGGTDERARWPKTGVEADLGLLTIRPTTGLRTGHLAGMRFRRPLLPRLRTVIVVLEIMAMMGLAVGPGPALVASAAEPSPSAAETPASPAPEPAASPEPTATPEPAPSAEPVAGAPDGLVPPPAPAADPAATPVPSAPEPSADPGAAPQPAPAPTAPAAAAATTSLIIRFKTSTPAADQDAAVTAHGGTVTASFTALGVRVIDVAAADVSVVMAAYRGDTAVATVEVDRVRAVDGTPSDPAYGAQWNLPRIGWDIARANASPSGRATIAVLDTGIYASHADLAGLVTCGWSAFGADPCQDPNGHGTAMAGIAAATTDNGTGIAGVAYAGTSLLSVQVLGADGTGKDSDIIAGLVWAADNGADVILMAFSSPGYSPALQAAIDYAWSRGAVLVAATGNDGATTPTYPAGDAHVMGVSATDSADSLAPNSNSGTDTFIAAPGVSIPALAVDGGVTTVSGTSASAAQLAGAAALLRALDPSASAATIVGRLARSADAAGTASQTGNGRLNLGRAVSDTSTAGVDPAGTGGPFVGPFEPPVYTAAAAALVGTIGTVMTSTVGANATPAWGASASQTAGNLLVAFVAVHGSATLPSTPAGWSLARQIAGTLTSASIFYKVATGADAAPVIAAITGATISAQLAEYSGLSGAPLGATGAAAGTTSPVAATLSAADATSGSLLLVAGSARYTAAVTANLTHTSNNATLTATNNNGSQQNHYAFGYGATTANAAADTNSMAMSSVTSISGAANVGAAFALAPTKLAITAISPASPSRNTAFSVTVQAQNASSLPAAVLANTGVSLALVGGSGTLSGTLTGTILAGTSSITISGVLYSVAEAGVSLNAARTSGDSLATSATSATFSVISIAQRGTPTTGVNTGTSLTIAMPTGVVAGDVMLVDIMQVGNNTVAPTAAGWTLVDGRTLAGTTKRWGTVMYRVAGASEAGPYTFTLGTGTTSAVGAIVAFTGVKSSVWDVAPGTILVQASSTTVGATTITTTSANAMVVMLGMAGGSSAPTWSGWTTTSPGALAEVVDARTTATANATVGIAWASKATAGATGAGAATLSAAQRHGAILLALSPASGATKLAVTSINPTTPGAGNAFSVTVQSQDASGNPVTVAASTGVTLSKATGAGTLGGTLTGTITAGSSSVTISGVTYSQADTGVSITATRSSGDVLTAGTSATFAVYGTATKLAFGVQPVSTTAGAAISPAVTVLVQDVNGTTVGDSTASVTMAITSGTPATGGPGTLSDTTPVSAIGGLATFSNLSINSIGTAYTLTATSGSLTLATSSAFNILDGNCIANVTGSWDVIGTWSCGHIPLATDNVSILGTATATAVTVTIPAAYTAVARSITLGVPTSTTPAVNNASSLAFAASTSTLTVSSNITINAPGASAIRNLNVGAGTLNVGGSMSLGKGAAGTAAGLVTEVTVSTGTLTVAGDLVLNADNFAGVSAAQNQILMSGGAGTFNLAGSFTVNVAGTVTPGTTSTFNFNGSSAGQTIPIGVSSVTYANIRSSNTSVSGTTLSAAMSATNVTGNLSVTAGTLSNGGFAIVGAAAKTLSVSAGATLELLGTSTLPTGYGTKTFDPDSTVEYGGDAQAVATATYGNLHFMGTAGAKTLASTGTITLAGDFVNDLSGSATVVNTGSTVSLASTVNYQTIGGTTPTTFNNLTVSNSAGGASLDQDTTAAGTLTLSGGVVSTGVNTLIVSGTGTGAISGGVGGATPAYVDGLLQRGIGAGSNTYAFPVGDATAYAPVSVAFTSVTTPGVITAETTAGNHPSIATSGISASQDVNRYWTLADGGGLAFSTYTPTFWWVAGETNGTINTGSLVVRKYASSAWTGPSTSTTYSSNSVTATSYAGTFGDYAVGNVGATQLAITAINGGSAVTAGSGFSITVQSQTLAGAAALVIANTQVTITLASANANTGGTLGGTLTGTITSGTSTATITGLTYTKAGTGTVLTASATSGMLLTEGNSAGFAVVAGAAMQLQVLLPDEVAAPGTSAGKTGAVTDTFAGTAVTVTVRVVDAFWNLVTVTNPTVTLTSGASHYSVSSPSMSGGTGSGSITFTTAGVWTVTASGTTPTLAGTSATIHVQPGVATKFQLLVPTQTIGSTTYTGQTADPGGTTGVTGTPFAVTPGLTFSVTVNAVDAYWNITPASFQEVQIQSSDTHAVLQGVYALLGGTKSMTISLQTAGAPTIKAHWVQNSVQVTDSPDVTITVNTGAATQLQVLLPGETAEPGLTTGPTPGKTGTPTDRSVGVNTTVIVRAVDAYWNLVTSGANSTVTLSSTDANRVLPYSGAGQTLSGGTFTFDSTGGNGITFHTAGFWTVSASGATPTLSGTSASIHLLAETTATKLLLLLPNETALPGSSDIGTGKTGTPTDITAGVSVTGSVQAVDTWWNPVTSAGTTPTITVTSTDGSAVLPANFALVAGAASFNFAFRTSGSQSVTVSAASYSSSVSTATVTGGSSGDGTLAVSPTFATAGSTGNTLTFTFGAAGKTFSAGSQMTLVVPAIWTAPQNTSSSTAGHIAVANSSGTTCSPSIASIAGSGPWTITVNQTCTGTNAFTITYGDDSSSKVTAPLLAGAALFQAQSKDGSAGTLTNLAVSPTVTVNPGAATKLLVLLPGQTWTQGVSGSASIGGTLETPKTVGTEVDVRVYAVDDYWNTTSAGPAVTLTSTDSYALGLPVTHTIVAGTETFPVIFHTAGASQTISAAATSYTGYTSSALHVDAGTATQLQVLVPPQLVLNQCGGLICHGETAVPGSPTGKTGQAPDDFTTGSSVNITVNLVDMYFNLVDSSASITLTTDGVHATVPASHNLSGGTYTFGSNSDPVKFVVAGYPRVTATDATFTATSEEIDVDPCDPVKFLVLLPGETADPGSSPSGSGKTGTPTEQVAGVPFGVTVNAVDDYWNTAAVDLDSGGGLGFVDAVVHLTSTDPAGVMPADDALFDGTGQLPVTFHTATLTGWTVTATYVSGDPVALNTIGPGGTPATATSSAVVVTAGAAAQLAFTANPSSSTQHGDTFATQPVVTVQDAFGNTVLTGTGSTASISLAIASGTPASGGPGTLFGTTTMDATSGVATFSGIGLRGVGSGYQLAATSSGLTTAASSELDIAKREITVTAAGATMAYSGSTLCASPTAGSCTPTVTSSRDLVGDSTWTTLTESFDSALPGNGRTLTPTAVVSDSANYAITLVPTADGIITGSIISAPGAWNLGTTYRGETVASAAGLLSWISYETSAKRVTAEMTSELTYATTNHIASSNVTLWKTDGATDTAVGTFAAKQTVQPIAANTNVTDSVLVFIRVAIPMDTVLGTYSGTITYTIEP